MKALSFFFSLVFFALGSDLAFAQGEDLRAYFPLDGNGIDESGHGNDCAIGGAQSTFDRFGNLSGALLFDGVNDYCQKDSPSNLDPNSGNWSASAWIRPLVITGSPQTIVGRYDCGFGHCNPALWRLFVASDGTASFHFRDDNSTVRSVSSAAIVVDGAWHHVAGVLDRENDQMRIYVDGELAGAANASGLVSIFDDSSPLSIGRWYSNTPGDYFNGELDEVRVFGSVSCGFDADTDGDCVADSQDNCLLEHNVSQIDADDDGFGNLCDADINNDCLTNFLDLGLLKQVFFTFDPVADLNNSGSVDFLDLGIFKSLFFQPPGPSEAPNACDGM